MERLDVYLCDRLVGALIGEKVVRDSIARQVSAVRQALPGLLDEVNDRWPSPVYHEICQGIHARIRQLEGKE